MILYCFFGGVAVNFDAHCIFVAVEIVGACSVGSHKFSNEGASTKAIGSNMCCMVWMTFF